MECPGLDIREQAVELADRFLVTTRSTEFYTEFLGIFYGKKENDLSSV
jgi:hypothetical protein